MVSVSSSASTKGSSKMPLVVLRIKPALNTLDQNTLAFILIFFSKEEIARLNTINRSFRKAGDSDKVWQAIAKMESIPLMTMTTGFASPPKEQVLQHYVAVNRRLLRSLCPYLSEEVPKFSDESQYALTNYSGMKKWLIDKMPAQDQCHLHVINTICGLIKDSQKDAQAASLSYDALRLIFRSISSWNGLSPSHGKHYRGFHCCDPLGFALPIKGDHRIQRMCIEAINLPEKRKANQKTINRLTLALIYNPIENVEREQLLAALLETYRPYESSSKNNSKHYAWCMNWEIRRLIVGYTFPAKSSLVNLQLLLRHCPVPIAEKDLYAAIDESQEEINLNKKAQLRRGYKILEIITDTLGIHSAEKYCVLSYHIKQQFWLNCHRELASALGGNQFESVMQALTTFKQKNTTISSAKLEEIRKKVNNVPDIAHQKIQLIEIYAEAKKLIKNYGKRQWRCVLM